MFIKTHAHGVALPQRLQQDLDKKVRLMLGLYEDKIRRVDVYLTDVNGPKGGEDISCKIKVDVCGGIPIIVQQMAETLSQAVGLSAHRVKRCARRRFERAAEHKRYAAKRILAS